jgi:hypothetical protein
MSFKEHFKNLIFSYYYYVKVYIFKIPKYAIKNIVLLVSKLLLNYFYATFKQWLQKVKSPYTYFSLIRLIPNFCDMYIMYSQ